MPFQVYIYLYKFISSSQEAWEVELFWSPFNTGKKLRPRKVEFLSQVPEGRASWDFFLLAPHCGAAREGPAPWGYWENKAGVTQSSAAPRLHTPGVAGTYSLLRQTQMRGLQAAALCGSSLLYHLTRIFLSKPRQGWACPQLFTVISIYLQFWPLPPS